MPDLAFSVPTEIKFGLDVANRVAAVVSEYGERALLVTEAILYEGKVIDRVQALLEKKGLQYIVYDEVVPNATSSAVDDGVKLARGAHADVIVGLGGMRTLSVGKCIAMVAAGHSDMDDYLSGMLPKPVSLPYVALPTTCRDPFLLTGEYLVTDSRDRSAKLGRVPAGPARAVIIDPRLSATLPPKFTATTLMDTFLAGVEGYLSSRNNFLSETFFLPALQLIGKTIGPLRDAPDDLRVRMNASTAGLLVALGLTVSRTGRGRGPVLRHQRPLHGAQILGVLDPAAPRDGVLRRGGRGEAGQGGRLPGRGGVRRRAGGRGRPGRRGRPPHPGLPGPAYAPAGLRPEPGRHGGGGQHGPLLRHDELPAPLHFLRGPVRAVEVGLLAGAKR